MELAHGSSSLVWPAIASAGARGAQVYNERNSVYTKLCTDKTMHFCVTAKTPLPISQNIERCSSALCACCSELTLCCACVRSHRRLDSLCAEVLHGVDAAASHLPVPSYQSQEHTAPLLSWRLVAWPR
jgi:hypothetical protein